MKCESCGHENLDEARFCASCGILLPPQGGDEHPWVGRLIGGRFRVTSVLGEGGMGVVYSGEQQMGSTVRRVAIKTLHPYLSQDPSVLARFHRECGTVAQLEHPNTIKVYDFGAEADGTLYIAMEFVDGRSLDRVIEEEGALDVERVTHIIEQICGALDEAHAQGIIHRDLKPENIILAKRLGKKDFVKVLDFGIASRSESADAAKEQKLTQQGMVLGTPPYMSPEQFTGQALDRRSDIYSLGIVTYQMLTGRLPFSATTAWQWATEHMTAAPYPLEQTSVGSRVPELVRKAVFRALSKTPADRQDTAGAFFQELAAGSAARDSGPGRSSTGTEAMPAAPAPLGGGTVPLAAVPAAVSGAMGPVATPAAMAAPPPPVRPDSGGGKGLAIGLAVVGLGLLVAMGVVLLDGSGSSGGEPPIPLLAEGGPTEPSAVVPESPVRPEDVTDPVEVGPDEPVDTKDNSPPSPRPPTTSKPPQTSPSAPSTPTAPPETPPPPATTPPPATNDCSACVSAVRSGNLQAAASSFNSCSSSGKTACQAEARRQAPTLVSNAAKSGNCTQAKALAAAARAMGASSARVDKALEDCP